MTKKLYDLIQCFLVREMNRETPLHGRLERRRFLPLERATILLRPTFNEVGFLLANFFYFQPRRVKKPFTRNRQKSLFWNGLPR